MSGGGWDGRVRFTLCVSRMFSHPQFHSAQSWTRASWAGVLLLPPTCPTGARSGGLPLAF